MCSSFYIVQEPPAGGRKLSPSCFLPVSFYQSLRLLLRLLQNSEAGKTGIRYTNASVGRGFRKRRWSSLENEFSESDYRLFLNVLRTISCTLSPCLPPQTAAKRLPQTTFSKRNRRSTRRHLNVPDGRFLYSGIKESCTRKMFLSFQKFSIPRQPSMSKTEGLRIVHTFIVRADSE